MTAPLHCAVRVFWRADYAPAFLITALAVLDCRPLLLRFNCLPLLLRLLQVGGGQSVIPPYRSDKPACGVLFGLSLPSVWKCRNLCFCGLPMRFDETSGFRLCHTKGNKFGN